MRKTLTSAVIALTVAGGLWTGAASAQTEVSVQAATCSGAGYVAPTVGDLNLRPQKNRNGSLGQLVKGKSYGCWPAEGGAGYSNLCGRNGDQWIPIDRNDNGLWDQGVDGFAPNVCLKDV